MTTIDRHPSDTSTQLTERDDFGVGLIDLLTWLGDGKRLIAFVTAGAALLSLAYSLTLTPIYTARTSLLPPGSQQQGGSAAALAALSSIGGLGDVAGGLGGKAPAELYVALLKSDSVVRGLDERFGLKGRYGLKTNETLRKHLPQVVRALADKKSGLINIEVDDKDPAFAADLANAHVSEITKVLGRLAVSEAQRRRAFFEQQLRDTKENLVKAEVDLQRVQEKSGFIVLDKQSEALITGAARVRSLIAEREVQLKVMRTGSTEQNAEVIRLKAEIAALRSELARMESSQGGNSGSTIDIPVGKIPEAAIGYVRARRELKMQETLLEAMARQFELAKLDEAREGPLLQQVDKALPPDYKSKPSRAAIVAAVTVLALLGSMAWVVIRRFGSVAGDSDAQGAAAWRAMKRAWRVRG
ncbi:MAG: Wzz/FepE/Etk N-terminal domain-containing protein [Pseudomonadota bacterium]